MSAELKMRPERVTRVLDEFRNAFIDSTIHQTDGRAVIDHIAELEASLAKAQEDARRLRAVFHVNMLRMHPSKSHEEITAAIDAALRETADKEGEKG